MAPAFAPRRRRRVVISKLLARRRSGARLGAAAEGQDRLSTGTRINRDSDKDASPAGCFSRSFGDLEMTRTGSKRSGGIPPSGGHRVADQDKGSDGDSDRWPCALARPYASAWPPPRPALLPPDTMAGWRPAATAGADAVVPTARSGVRRAALIRGPLGPLCSE